MEEIIQATTASVTATIALLPVGTIMPFAGDQTEIAGLAIQGWLLCDGSLKSKAKFPQLNRVLKNACGGDTQEDFVLPDLQGVFLRGVDSSKGRDPNAGTRTPQKPGGNTGDHVLTWQQDDVKAHTHIYAQKAWHEHVYATPGSGGYHFPRILPTDGETAGVKGQVADVDGKESRPKNVSVNYIIFAGLPQTA